MKTIKNQVLPVFIAMLMVLTALPFDAIAGQPPIPEPPGLDMPTQDNLLSYALNHEQIETMSRSPGDVNGDGYVTEDDLLLLREYLAGYPVNIIRAASDVNGDGEITAADVLLLRMYLEEHPAELLPGLVDTPDSQFLNPTEIGIIGNGNVNRVQWLTMLVEAANLDADDYVRNYLSNFIDVNTNNPWFQAYFSDYAGVVEVALQNNIIVASTQDEYMFHPALSATEAFAVVTAIRALGFYFDEYHDLQDVFEIAMDIELFATLPTLNNLTQSQANAILVVVRDIVTPPDFSGPPIVEVDFCEYLVWISEDNDYIISVNFNEITGLGTIHLAAAAAGLFDVGDILMLPPTVGFVGGLAKRVLSTYVQPDNTLILSTQLPGLEDLIAEDGGLYIRGSFEAELDNFTVNPNLKEEFAEEGWIFINEIDDDFETFQIMPYSNAPVFQLKEGRSGGRDVLIASISASGDDTVAYDFSATATVYMPTVRPHVCIEWREGILLDIPIGINSFRTELVSEASVKIDGEIQYSLNRRLGVFRIPIAATGFVASVAMYLEVSLSGEINIEYRIVATVGVEISRGHIRFYDSISQDLTVDLNARAYAGVKGALWLSFYGLDLADINVHIGLGAHGRILRNQSPPPFYCKNVDAYLYMRLSGLTRGVVSWFFSPFHQNIWTISNSPVRRSWHWEDGVRVDECTVGKTDSFPDLLGVWNGIYHNNNGLNGLRLTMFNDGTRYRGVFHFFPVAGSPPRNNQTGSFFMDVNYDHSTGRLVLTGSSWINRPFGWITVDLYGLVAGNIFSGFTNNIRTMPFQVIRTDVGNHVAVFAGLKCPETAE